MKALLEKKYITFGFISALIIILAVNYTLYKNITGHFEDEKFVANAVNTITLCENLLTNLHEASSNRRGYLITSDQEFLNEYYSSIKSVDSLFKDLKHLPLNNIREMGIIDTLGPLILARKDLFEEAIELQQNKNKLTRQQIALTEKGGEAQKKLKYYIGEIEDEEHAILGVRNQMLSRSAYIAILNMIIGTAIAFILLIVPFILLHHNITQRKIYEKGLKESRNWFFTTLTSIGDAVIAADRYGDIEFMNPVAENLTGWKIEEARGKDISSVFMVINEATRQPVDNPINKVIREGKIVGLANHSILINHHGKEIPIDDSAAPIFSEAGKILGVVLVFRDITARRQMELELKHHYERLEEIVGERTRELRLINERLQQEIIERIKAEQGIAEAEIKFRSLVENALVGIYIVQDNKFAYVNPRFEETFGYAHNELNGKDIHEILTEEDRSLVFENIRKRLEGEIEDVHYSYKAVKKYGTLIEVEARGTTMEFRGKVAIIGTLMDVTERMCAEEALKNQEQFLRTIIDADPTFIFVKDENGKIRIANKAFAEFHGTTPEEILGKTAENIISEKGQVEQVDKDDEQVLRTGFSLEVPERLISSRSGKSRYFQVTKVPLSADGARSQILTVATDITERKLAEDGIKKSLKEKELLLQEIHHRVKNNLQIIVSLFKLQSKFIYDKRDLEIFHKSRSRVETMALIHENLYRTADLANIGMGNYIRSLTHHLLQVYGFTNESVKISVKADNVRLGIDTAIPCGLLINELVSNSLKHAFPHLKSEGKKSKKRNENDGDCEINISLSKNNGKVELTVSDNGAGLPKGLDMNRTESLGMQLIHTLTKQLEGKIEVFSDGGAKFIFTFEELKYSQRY